MSYESGVKIAYKQDIAKAMVAYALENARASLEKYTTEREISIAEAMKTRKFPQLWRTRTRAEALKHIRYHSVSYYIRDADMHIDRLENIQVYISGYLFAHVTLGEDDLYVIHQNIPKEEA